jgi:hypothetical protein
LLASLHGLDYLYVVLAIMGGSVLAGFLAAVVAFMAAVLARARARQGVTVTAGRAVAAAIGLLMVLALPLAACVYWLVAK